MTPGRRRLCALGSGVAKAALCLIGLALVVLALSGLFYTHSNDRLIYLGTAFVLSFVLLRVLRAMARQPATVAAR